MKTVHSVLIACCLLSSVPVANAMSAYAPPMTGQRYNVGGYDLHISCMGHGQPTVVIDSGLGDDSYDWLPIQKKSSKYSQVCVYDRAGYGWSDAGPAPRTSDHIARELTKLLNKANIRPPYILVGHSFGGYNVRVFTADHPKEVEGMILVDASHERQYDLLHIRLPPSYRRKNVVVQPKPTDAMANSTKPPYLQERAYRAATREIAFMRESAREVQQLPAMPRIPLIVISRGESEWKGSSGARNREKIWTKLQNDLTKLSPLSEHIFAFKSGHDVPREQPDIIVDAISDMVQEARAMN